MSRRILLMHISEVSGHRKASMAVEKAIKLISPDTRTLGINAFNYTNPVWERIINRVYLGVLKNAPEVWDYLYDNPKVLRRVRRIRGLIHKANSEKVKALFDDFRPDAVVCTQAYPCGLVADYKKTFDINTPLIGVLTDYAPHSYWIYDNVDYYVVPSKGTGQKLVRDGVLEEKIKTLGIPIDPKFTVRLDDEPIRKEFGIDKNLPVILLMGGGQGLGPIKKILGLIDRIGQDFQVIVVAGTNKKLHKWIMARRFKKKVIAFGYVDFIERLMEISTLIITKPGGITTAEALAKDLPMIIINPLPGQEAMNTKFLLDEGLALKAENESNLAELLDWLLANPGKLKQIAQRITQYAKPDAALRIAELALNAANRSS